MAGRRDGFLILLTRLGIDLSVADRITDEEISYTIQTEQIKDEKISTADYSAILNIKFSKEFIERLLNQKKAKDDEALEQFSLIIPVEIDGTAFGKSGDPQTSFSTRKGEWWEAIAAAVKKKQLKPNEFKIAELDAEDATVLGTRGYGEVKYEQLSRFAAKYKTGRFYLVFFWFDDVENKANVVVREIRSSGVNQVKLGLINVGMLSVNELTKQMAEKTLVYIIGIKDQKILTTEGVASVLVPLSNLAEWASMKNKIEKNSLIKQLNIESISRDYVKVSILYTGDESDLIESFTKLELFLERREDGNYALYPLNTSN